MSHTQHGSFLKPHLACVRRESSVNYEFLHCTQPTVKKKKKISCFPLLLKGNLFLIIRQDKAESPSKQMYHQTTILTYISPFFCGLKKDLQRSNCDCKVIETREYKQLMRLLTNRLWGQGPTDQPADRPTRCMVAADKSRYMFNGKKIFILISKCIIVYMAVSSHPGYGVL